MNKEECIKRYFSADGDDRHLKNNIHKYLMRDDKSDDEILNEIIENNSPCIYQQTTNQQSSLFLAMDAKREIIIKKLIEIYEIDFKVLKTNGYDDESCSVLIAYGEQDKKFVEEKLKNITNTDGDKKIFILFKQTNEVASDVKVISTPKNEDERRIYLEILERLHINGTFDINTGSIFGERLIHVAAYNGMISVIEKLVEIGAKYDTLTNQDESAFYFACINDQLDAVKWIYRKFKIDLLHFMTKGDFLFKLAEYGVTEVFDFIIDEIAKHDGDEFVKEIMHRKSDKNQRNILHEAAYFCQFKFLMNAFRYTNDLKDVDHLGSNVLQIVLKCSKPDLEIVKYLIDKQPDIIVSEDCQQRTALHMMSTHNFVSLIENIYQTFPFYKSSFFKNFADTPSIEKEMAKIWVESPGHRALREVVKFNHIEMFQFIIENHDKIEFENSPYISGLIELAAEHDDGLELMKKISKLQYFNPDISSERGSFPLISALKAKKLENFKFLLNQCKDLNRIIDNVSGMNLFGLAIMDQNIRQEMPNDDFQEEFYKIFQDLITRGINIHHCSKHKENLLHIAVKNNNLKIVELLLELGFKVEDVNELGENAFHLFHSEEVFNILKDKCKNFTELINQKSKENSTPVGNFIMKSDFNDPKNVSFIEKLCKFKPEVLCQGLSPLFYISNVKVAKILLDLEIDPNITNEYGENCVHFALRNRNFDIARFILLNSDINQSAMTNENESYLHYLIYGEDYRKFFLPNLDKIFYELLDKFINEKTIEKRLILNTLIKSGEIKFFNHLKANFHQLDVNNMTCLHSAVTSDVSLQIIKFLITEKCADLNAIDDQERTALMRCIDKMKSDIATYLIDLEQTNLEIADLRGDTCLHYAARNNNVKIICKLLRKQVAVTTNKSNLKYYDYLNDFNQKLFVNL
jgi:ankyrin repeat protein